MGRFLGLLIVAALALGAFYVFGDQERRERFFGTIEGSTGVDLDQAARDTARDAGRAIGDFAEDAVEGLGDFLTDPAFRRSLERFGRDALDALEPEQLKDLGRDLRRERDENGDGADLDSVLERYLGREGSS